MADKKSGPAESGIPSQTTGQTSGLRHTFLRPRSRRTMKNPVLGRDVTPAPGGPQSQGIPAPNPWGADPNWRAAQLHRLRHQDYRATAARGRSRQTLERAKANLREARIALEKDDITGARRATEKALGIARATGASPMLRGTPIGAEAENTMQEAVALAMYLAETLEGLETSIGRFDREPAAEKALSRRLNTDV